VTHHRVLLVTAAAMAGAAVALAQQAPAPPPQLNFDAVMMRPVSVRPNVWMIAGAGGNTTIQFGDEGVLVVDTQFAQVADKLLAEIDRISGNKPIRYLVNTHVHPDTLGGNERLRRAGNVIAAGNVALDLRDSGAAIFAHENVLFRLSKPAGNAVTVPAGALPTDTFFGARDEISFNGEAVELLHQPKAHTDGDVVVFFRRSDVVATGDVYVTTGYPLIDLAQGGTINGIIAALNRIIDLTVPHGKQEGGTVVIPGHGRIGDEADVVDYRDMITIIRDCIEDMIKKREDDRASLRSVVRVDRHPRPARRRRSISPACGRPW